MKFKFGQPISEELSTHLMEFTNKKDIADVSQATGVSISTIDYVKRRNNSVTENNEVGIIALMEIAVKNAESHITKAKTCKKDLQEILDLV